MNLHRQLRLAANLALGLAMFWGGTPVPAQNPTAQSPKQFRIAGTVVNAASGSPIAQARVWIFNVHNPEVVRSTTTSGDGHFEFNQLGAGKYSLQGSRRGFIAASYDAHEQYASAIVAGAAVDSENLSLRLNPGAVLSGTVLDETGEPVRQSTVTLYREDHSIGLSQVVQFNNTQTDDIGSYEFAGLAPGNYFVAATAKPWYAIHRASSVAQASSDASVDTALDVAYPTTYYPDTTDPDQAPPIPLKAGDRAQAEIRLRPVPALHLRFHVQHGYNMPRLQSRAFDAVQDIATDDVQLVEPGVYELTGVTPGRYSLRIAGSSNDVDLMNDGQELDAQQGEPVSSVKASVQVLGQKELPAGLQLVLSDSHRKLTVNQNPAKGVFSFGDIEPGKYTVLAFAQEAGKAYGVTRLSSQGSEITGHTINVPPGTNLEISVSLAEGTANVEGFAKRGGKGVAGAMIVMVPQDPENNRELFRRDQSDLDGSFTLLKVIPGTYAIVAIENGWELDWSQPAVILQYAKHAQTVKVDPQAQSSVHVPEPVEVQAK